MPSLQVIRVDLLALRLRLGVLDGTGEPLLEGVEWELGVGGELDAHVP